MTYLKIDTSKQSEIEVILETNGKIEKIKKENLKGSEILLPLIKEILSKNKLTIEKVDKLFVKQGPGSYTGIRVGLSVANTLSHFLKIPVNNQSSGKIIEPIYK